MTAKTPTNTQPVSRRRQAALTRSPKLRIGKALKRVIHLMIHEGKSDYEACQESGFTLTALRLAMKRPHVRKYMIEERQVFSASLCAANSHRLASIRDGSPNAMARLGAIRMIEEIANSEQRTSSLGPQTPGVTIVIAPPTHEAQSGPIIDVRPNASTAHE